MAGVATYGNLSIDSAAAGYTLTATAAPGLSGVSTAFTITTGGATRLAFTVQPTQTVAGAAITPAVQVTARDIVGNTVTSFTGAVTIAIGTNAGGGTLSGITVRNAVAELSKSARIVSGDPEAAPVPGDGAFISPILLRSDDPWGAAAIHDVEAFGPVSTIMPYRDLDDAIALANRGMGSLALSLFTYSPEAAREFIQGAAAFHGRMLVINRDNAKESTGHGSPLPVLVHGGPGRAGGSEEMGGTRGVKHYMQRTAIQSTPAMIAAISEQYIPGGPKHIIAAHPFRKRMSELSIGDTLKTASRTVTIDDIEHFGQCHQLYVFEFLRDERVEVVAAQLAVGDDVAPELVLQSQEGDDRLVCSLVELLPRDPLPPVRSLCFCDLRRPRPAADRRHRKERQRHHGQDLSKKPSEATAAVSGPNPVVLPGSQALRPSRSIISRCDGLS